MHYLEGFILLILYCAYIITVAVVLDDVVVVILFSGQYFTGTDNFKGYNWVFWWVEVDDVVVVVLVCDGNQTLVEV